MGAMLGRPFGIILLAGALLVAGLGGVAAFWSLATYVQYFPSRGGVRSDVQLHLFGHRHLTWRRSRLAPLSFLAAIGLPLFPASFIAPRGQLLVPSFMVIVPVAFLGYRYLGRARQPPPSGR
jgi:hypothetical protein